MFAMKMENMEIKKKKETLLHAPHHRQLLGQFEKSPPPYTYNCTFIWVKEV